MPVVSSVSRPSRSNWRRIICGGAVAALLAGFSPAPSGQGDVTPRRRGAVSGRECHGGVDPDSVRAVFSEPIQSGTLVMQLRNSAASSWRATVTYDAAEPDRARSTRRRAGRKSDVHGDGQRRPRSGRQPDDAGELVVHDRQRRLPGHRRCRRPGSSIRPSSSSPPTAGCSSPRRAGASTCTTTSSDTTPTLVVDLRISVHNFWDRGMLGMALHPNFPATPYIYVLYAYDAVPGGAAPRWGTAGQVGDPLSDAAGSDRQRLRRHRPAVAAERR